MARRYDLVARPRPRISVGWTVALVIVALAVLRAIYKPLAIAVVVFAALWVIGVVFVRAWQRHGPL